MHNPPHPGEFIQEAYLEPNEISCRELSSKLGVAASTLSRILKGSSGISPEMALRLSKAIGRSPENGKSAVSLFELFPDEARIETASSDAKQDFCRCGSYGST